MTAPLIEILRADAVVVGGGPVGGLTAYQLARFGCVPYIVEQDNKPDMPIYGRATTLWPRTLELWDQLDVLDAMLDIGVISKTGFNFDYHGNAAPGGLVFGHRMDKLADTAFKFALHLRQRLQEQVFDDALAALGHDIHYEHRLESFTCDENATDGYPVTCTFLNLRSQRTYQVKTKYLIAADGAKSPIRKAAGIEYIGTRTTSKWIRFDALVKTDMPSPRSLNSIQSKDHGLILFCPIDEGKTRIGYVFNKELQGKYGEDGVTVEVAKEEAIKAMAPFTLSFESVDWFTLYGIGQCIASDFVKGRVILVGDACHSHSSGSAQGVNTGTHDSVNLVWKLALILKGQGRSELLKSYHDERKASVQQVIDNDVIIASLISGNLPPKYEGRTESPKDILTEWFDNVANQAFAVGLGVAYPPNNLINSSRIGWPLSTCVPGTRGPDVTLSRVGTAERLRLHKVLPNTGAFNLLVFTGRPSTTLPLLQSLRKHLDSAAAFTSHFPPTLLKFTSIIAGEGIGPDEFVGVKMFGRRLFDPLREAHEVYGIDVGRGAVVVLRPDGIVGTVVGLGEAASLTEYFDRFLVSK